MAASTLSFTEKQVFSALRSFLGNALDLAQVDVIRGEYNRVPEPLTSDFVVMTQIGQNRLETNETSFDDNVFTGIINGTTMSVAPGWPYRSLAPGYLVIDDFYPVSNVAPNTYIVSQLSGTPGQEGDYQVSVAQNLTSQMLLAGVRKDLVATDFCVQLDVHGPNSGNTVRIIDTLFRSDYGTDAFEASGFTMDPLYCDDARQVPYINDQQQYEFRWSIDAHIQISPVVQTSQRFAQEVHVPTVVADLLALPQKPSSIRYLTDTAGNLILGPNGQPIVVP